MGNFFQPKYEVFLYRYKPDFYKKLGVKDLEDIRLTTPQLTASNRAVYEKEFDTVVLSTMLKANPELESLRTALKENYVVQRLQQDNDPLNWMSLWNEKKYDGDFKKESESRKLILGRLLDDIILQASTNTLSTVIAVTPLSATDKDSDKNIVLELAQFNTSLSSIDNGIVLHLDARKMQSQNITIVENDVIEIAITYPNEDKPKSVFFGFVVSVSITEQFGNMVAYSITCSGIGKYLQLSKVIKDAAIVSQFEAGIEVNKTGIAVFENLFNNLNVIQMFDDLMSRVFDLQSKYAGYSQLLRTYGTTINEKSALQSYLALTQGFSENAAFDLTSDKYKKAKDDFVAKSRSQGLTDLANFINKAYSEAITVSQYITALQAKLNELNAQIAEYTKKSVEIGAAPTPKDTGTRIPYQLYYSFPFESKLTDKYVKGEFVQNAFQFAVSLTLLLYCARRMSTAAANLRLGTQSLQDVMAVFTSADDEQYKVYNLMQHQAWEKFYSQSAAPVDLMDEIRTNTFYEVFEDRPDIIYCRPPRYNVWEKGNVIDTASILEMSKVRNDAQLASWMGYRFVFPLQGMIDFVGGKYSDLDILIKYGLRADAPKLNPNVISSELGRFFSALDLIKSNVSTRVINVTVTADRDYQLGTLYFIPNKGVTAEELQEAENRGVQLGVVGYVNNIATEIRYGQTATHALELIYIRKAELKDNYLNFYRMPDLETFMQWAEALRKTYDLSKTTNVDVAKTASEEQSRLDTWLNNPALSFGGYYYAVNPLHYAIFRNMPTTDLDDYIRRRNLGCYIINTGFLVTDFQAKSHPTVPAFISQELINRLWLLDFQMRNPAITTDPGKTTITLYGDGDSKVWDEYSDVSETVKMGTELHSPFELGYIGSPSALVRNASSYRRKKSSQNPKDTTTLDCVRTNLIHHAEFTEFNNLRSESNSGIRYLLDYLFIVRQMPIKVFNQSTNQEVVFYALSNVSDVEPYASGRPGSIFYRISPVVSMLAPGLDEPVSVDTIEVGLKNIPLSKRYNISGFLASGAATAYKFGEDTPIASPNTYRDNSINPHNYGMEIDLLPELLEYWSLKDLEKVLTFGLFYSGIKPMPSKVFRYEPVSPFADFSDSEKESYYIKANLVGGGFARFKNMLAIGKQLRLDIKKGEQNNNSLAHVKGEYSSLSGSAFTIDKPVETVHVQVEHKCTVNPTTKGYGPEVAEPVYFYINYVGAEPAVMPNVAQTQRNYAFWSELTLGAGALATLALVAAATFMSGGLFIIASGVGASVLFGISSALYDKQVKIPYASVVYSFSSKVPSNTSSLSNFLPKG